MPLRRAEAGGPATRGGLPAVLLQAGRYGVSGGAALATLLVVLVVAVEVFGCPSTPASALAFACATPVNYLLQHRFVFRSSQHHGAAFPRYLGVTLATMGLNTLVFWCLVEQLGMFYPAAQVVTTAVVVPANFVLNRAFTFADIAATAR